MKPQHLKKVIPCLILILAIAGLSACSSTRTEQGVTIEQNRGLNPLNYIPGL
ncbi:MAG: hypothetical protein GVY36_13510 [Verrucomicrobia bacterium]|jgi:uncharacterized lipoprotein|nr:hypothetical protein [Verrucomicrobiota bacterium]